jgi:hypothetical protein
MKRPPLRPISTWIVGGALALTFLLSLFTGMGTALIWLGLFAIATGIYVVAFRRGSWARLPRSRGIGGVVLGTGLVVMIVGAAISPTTHSATVTAAPASFTLRDWTGSSASDATASLRRAAHDVRVVTDDGGAAPADLAGWVVDEETPAPGSVVGSSQRIVLVVHESAASGAANTPPPTRKATPSPTPTVASASPTSTPTVAAPQPLVAQPAPAPAAPAPAAPAPAAPAPAPVTGTVNPGGFCSPSDVGKTAVASNGRAYTCGGKGADASGHFHWNVP